MATCRCKIDSAPIPPASLVSGDGGQAWAPGSVVSTSFQVQGVSCPTTPVCWAAGVSRSDTPAVAESTDGGQTWTDRTPAA